MKNVLGKMERFIEQLVEGFFGLAADNLPAGILRQLATNIEQGALVKGDQKWAPPDCHILLTREAMRLILPIQDELEEELRTALARFAERQGLDYPSPLRFKFGVADGQGAAVISTSAVFSLPPPGADKEDTICGGKATVSTKVFRRTRPRPTRAWLRVESGPDQGRELHLIEDILRIGRHVENHLVLDDPNVSRSHAAVVFEHGDYFIVDQGSTNGTIVNGRKVGRHRLSYGDRIKVGQTILAFYNSSGRA